MQAQGFHTIDNFNIDIYTSIVHLNQFLINCYCFSSISFASCGDVYDVEDGSQHKVKTPIHIVTHNTFLLRHENDFI